MNKKDVLPASEIRSARPLRTLIANNLIYNHQTDFGPVKTYDKVDGIIFRNNLVDNQANKTSPYDGINVTDVKMNKISEWLYVPDLQDDDIKSTYSGFGFEDIQKDAFGRSRVDMNAVGAVSQPVSEGKARFEISEYGANWYSPQKPQSTSMVISVSTTDGELDKKLAEADDGDVLELASGIYQIDRSIVINKKITLRSKDKNNAARLIYSGAKNTPAFQMNPGGNLNLENIILNGTGAQDAFVPMEKNMSSAYNLYVNNSHIQNFKNVLKAFKGSFADTISFSGTVLQNCSNGLVLAAETDDKGDYNAEFVNIIDCSFENISQNVINFYRGGYDESTIGGNLLVQNSQFKNCGTREESKILIKTRGIINVNVKNNTFNNNPVKLVALLWGEKNNQHSENTITNSGKIRVDQYLKQKLMY